MHGLNFGAILALIVLLLLAICYNNGRKAKYSEDTETLNEVEEEEAVPFKDAIKMLFWKQILGDCSLIQYYYKCYKCDCSGIRNLLL